MHVLQYAMAGNQTHQAAEVQEHKNLYQWSASFHYLQVSLWPILCLRNHVVTMVIFIFGHTQGIKPVPRPEGKQSPKQCAAGTVREQA